MYIITSLACNYYNYSLVVGFSPHPGVQVPESQQYQPEELNKKALAITDRVKQKLTGQSHSSLLTPDPLVLHTILQVTISLMRK